MQKEAQECKYTVLIFMLSVSVLCGHRFNYNINLVTNAENV